MIVRFLAGLPAELSWRLTLRERLDPARHRFNQFVAKLHELEEAENVTKVVNAAVMDEQRKAGNQGAWRPDRPCLNEGRLLHGVQHAPVQQRNTRQPMERRRDDHLLKGKGPSPDVMCFRCQGKGHYSGSPACPMTDKSGSGNCQLRDRPQLKAARVSETGGEVTASYEPPEVVEDAAVWDDGSQWESVTEGEGSLHSHGDPQQLNRISITDILSEPEDDDRVYVRAVREKVVAMRKENPSRAAMHLRIDRP